MYRSVRVLVFVCSALHLVFNQSLCLAYHDSVVGSDPSLTLFYSRPISILATPPLADSSNWPTGESGHKVDRLRFGVVSGSILASLAAVHIYQQNGWWRDNRRSFHFQEDLVYALNADKIGHFYGGYLLGYAISKSYEWANVPPQTALWIGAGGSLLFQTYVEVLDGFSHWGFDGVDFFSNVAGASWMIARSYFPALKAVDLKISYRPSDLLGNSGGVGFQGQQHLVIDDYDGQTYWLTLKIEEVLPASVRSLWPDFLGLAVGYGARGIATDHPHRVYFLAPDIDMTKLIPPRTPFLKTLGEVLNFIHLPLPAIQFRPTTIWYGIYF